MTGQRGISVIELLAASAVFMTVCGAILTLLHDGLAATPVLEETTDLHQRARVVSDALAADVRAAARGAAFGPLTTYLAPVEPRGAADPPATVLDRVITIRSTVPGGASARLSLPLDPGGVVAVLDAGGCPAGSAACGFTTGARAFLLDPAGVAAFVRVEAIAPGTLLLSDVHGGRATTFPAGTIVAEGTEVTYSIDGPSRQLRRAEGDGMFVVADNVVSGTFAYRDAALAAVPLGSLADGPIAGSGALAFDVDLRRIAVVEAALRIESGADGMRGTDPRFFERPGTAVGPLTIPDVVCRVSAAVRNGGGP